MTRQELEAHVEEVYGILPDYPFDGDGVTAVFRHRASRKWFAIVMRISASKLGLPDTGTVDVVNLKCAPEVIESLAGIEQGIYRAYHMNKTHWLTVALSECEQDMIEWLLGISHDLTRGKRTSRGKRV